MEPDAWLTVMVTFCEARHYRCNGVAIRWLCASRDKRMDIKFSFDHYVDVNGSRRWS